MSQLDDKINQYFAGLVVRLERTGRPAHLDFLGPLIEICDVIACLRKCRRGCPWGSCWQTSEKRFRDRKPGVGWD